MTMTITERARVRQLCYLYRFVNEEDGWARELLLGEGQTIRALVVPRENRWFVTVGDSFRADYAEARNAFRAAFDRLEDEILESDW